MTVRTEVVADNLDILLDRLVLQESEPTSGWRNRFYTDMAFERARSVLRWEEDSKTRGVLETRIRLAVHLSPRSALAYDRSDTRPRWRIIHKHLVDNFQRDPLSSEPLARAVAVVLDNWDRAREQVTNHRTTLLRRDGNRCKHCHVEFSRTPTPDSVLIKDEFKPYFRSPEELLTPEVDHVESVSTLGTNALSNLQILCRLCNAGKGDGLGINTRDEIKFAVHALEDFPIAHRCRLIYYVISRDNNACTSCGSDDQELTIRPIIAEGALVRSNLRTVCTLCVCSKQP